MQPQLPVRLPKPVVSPDISGDDKKSKKKSKKDKGEKSVDKISGAAAAEEKREDGAAASKKKKKSSSSIRGGAPAAGAATTTYDGVTMFHSGTGGKRANDGVTMFHSGTGGKLPAGSTKKSSSASSDSEIGSVAGSDNALPTSLDLPANDPVIPAAEQRAWDQSLEWHRVLLDTHNLLQKSSTLTTKKFETEYQISTGGRRLKFPVGGHANMYDLHCGLADDGVVEYDRNWSKMWLGTRQDWKARNDADPVFAIADDILHCETEIIATKRNSEQLIKEKDKIRTQLKKLETSLEAAKVAFSLQRGDQNLSQLQKREREVAEKRENLEEILRKVADSYKVAEKLTQNLKTIRVYRSPEQIVEMLLDRENQRTHKETHNQLGRQLAPRHGGGAADESSVRDLMVGAGSTGGEQEERPVPDEDDFM